MDMATNDLRIRTVLNRLETIVDAENAGIGVDPDFDLQTSNAHKSRCLYELAMLSRDIQPEEMPKSVAPQLKSLREKLAANAQRVAAHLEAVRAVVQLLKDAVREQEADGTYSQEQFRFGYQP
jgi:flagellar biosynthesis/type III secretory pathway chaperone